VVGEAEGAVVGAASGDAPPAGVVVSPPQAVKLAAIPRAKNKPIAFLVIKFPLVNRDQRQNQVKNHHMDEKTPLLYQPQTAFTLFL
jgi:hypothetical protein